MKEATRPSSASEAKSFVGLVGFSSIFIPDFATKAEPLRVLCQKNEKFLWGRAQEEAFQHAERRHGRSIHAGLF